jgi:hypothetical protein
VVCTLSLSQCEVHKHSIIFICQGGFFLSLHYKPSVKVFPLIFKYSFDHHHITYMTSSVYISILLLSKPWLLLFHCTNVLKGLFYFDVNTEPRPAVLNLNICLLFPEHVHITCEDVNFLFLFSLFLNNSIKLDNIF